MDAWVRSGTPSGTPSGAWQRAHTCSVVTTSGLGRYASRDSYTRLVTASHSSFAGMRMRGNTT